MKQGKHRAGVATGAPRLASNEGWSPDRIHTSSMGNDLDGCNLKRTPKKTPDGVSLPLACHELSLHA
jgi:hypothetical protein